MLTNAPLNNQRCDHVYVGVVRNLMRSFYCLLVLLSFTTFSWAQSVKTDSLRQLLTHTKDEKSKAILLNQLAFQLRQANIAQALYYAKQAQTLAEKLRYTKALGPIYSNLGWIYYRQSRFTEAFNYSLKGLKISEDLNDKEEIVQCLNNMGALYSDQFKYDLGLKSLKRALTISEELGNNYLIGRTLNNLTFNYMDRNMIDSAYRYGVRAVQFCQKTKEPYLHAFALRTLGDIYIKQRQYIPAAGTYRQSLQIASSIQDNFLVGTVSYRLAEVHYIQNHFLTALSYLNEGLISIEKYGNPDELSRIYLLMSKIYHKKNEEAKAYEYLNKHTLLHDSVYNQESARQLALLESRFEAEKKQSQINSLTKNKQMQEKQLQSQKQLIYVAIGGLLVFTLLFALLVYVNQQRSQVTRQLTEQKNELASKNSAITVQSEKMQAQAEHLKKVNTVKDKLFSIIGHDLRGPVYSLKSILEFMDDDTLSQEEFAAVSKKLRKNVDSTHVILENLLQWSRAQLEGIRTHPERIHLFPFVEGKKELFANNAKDKNIEIVNNTVPGIYVTADFNQLQIIFRNLLGNAIKFTPQGGSVFISAIIKDEHAEISVRDTGVGMKPEELSLLFRMDTHFSKSGTNLEKGTGLGLLLCKEFVENNGGQIWAESQTDKGSVFRFTLPLS